MSVWASMFLSCLWNSQYESVSWSDGGRLFHTKGLLAENMQWYKSRLKIDYITNLNVQVPVQKLEHVLRIWSHVGTMWRQ